MSQDIVEQVEDMLICTGCTVVGIGPHSVAVMGDARFYGPSIIIKFPYGTSVEEMGKISTKITNEIKGISRVLAEVSPE